MTKRCSGWLLVLWLLAGCSGSDRAPQRNAAASEGSLSSGWFEKLRRFHHHQHPDPDPKECPAPPDPTPVCSWKPYDDGLSGTNVSAVFADPRAPGVIYAASGTTLWRSAASAASFGVQAELELGAIAELGAYGDDPKELLAASSSGVLRSSDAGKSWSRVALEGLSLTTVVAAPSQPLQLYAAADGVGVLRSLSGGTSF